MTAQRRDRAIVDLLAMVAFYHVTHALDHWHCMPIGAPWLPGSACDHLLVSLPYLHGPDLEKCALPEGHARILWLLPITTEEKDFRIEHGTDALEERFDEAGIDLPTPSANPWPEPAEPPCHGRDKPHPSARIRRRSGAATDTAITLGTVHAGLVHTRTEDNALRDYDCPIRRAT